jgi:WD40 repeat protein
MLVVDCGPDAVTALAFGPDGTAFIGTRAGSLLRSDGFGVSAVSAVDFVAQMRPVLCVAGPVAGDAVYFGGPYGAVRVTIEAATLLQSAATNRTVMGLAAVSPGLVAVGFGDPVHRMPGSFELFDVKTWEPKAPVTRESTGVRAVAAHPPTQTVAWATGGRQVVVWPITKPDKWRVSLPAAVPSLAFHPDGRWLAAAQDWTVLPIDTERKQLRDALKGHKGRVTAVTFHPHDGTLYSTSWDGTVRLWDVGSGTERTGFDWKLGRQLCLAISPDGTRAAAGSGSGKVVFWDVA